MIKFMYGDPNRETVSVGQAGGYHVDEPKRLTARATEPVSFGRFIRRLSLSGQLERVDFGGWRRKIKRWLERR